MIKVFRIRDIIKYFIRILIPITILFIILQIVSNQNLVERVEKKSSKNALLDTISSTITQIGIVENEKKTTENKDDFIFLPELVIAKNIKELDKVEENNQEEVEANIAENEKNQENIVQANDDKVTEVIESGVSPRVTNEFNGIKINNISSHELTEEILNPDIEINKSKVIKLFEDSLNYYIN